MIRKPVAVVVVLHLLASPVSVLGAPTIPGFHGPVSLPTPPAVNTLPSPRGNAWTGVDSIDLDTSRNRMVINQNKEKAVIDWNSFDIGKNSSVHFSQKNDKGEAQKDWAALNRIYDLNPSQIYGSLTADGKVYLINQNGILFGPGSRVNVNSLIASTMNLRDRDFLDGSLRFTAENYQSPDYTRIELLESYLKGTMTDAEYTAYVRRNLALAPPFSAASAANHGTITTGEGGFVYLIGPSSENSGEIIAPSGNIGLVAALPFSGRPTEADGLFDYDISISNAGSGRNGIHYHKYLSGGEAVNYETGRLISDAGKVGMYGGIVNQNGVVRSVTAVKRNGIIELLASEKVATGTDSLTSSPISDSTDTAHESFGFSGGKIRLAGLDRMYLSTDGVKKDSSAYPAKRIEHRGKIEAPSALEVSLEAEERVFLESGSSIDVRGLWVDMPASASVVEAQLNSVNLKDEFIQKSGILLGEKVKVYTLAGSTIGDVSGYLNVEEMTAQQRSVTGGVISIGSRLTGVNTGEIVVKEGAELTFAGGGYNYEAGVINPTKLLCGEKVYDISNAPSTYAYSKILGVQETVHRKFGMTEKYEGLYLGGSNPLGDLASSRVQGSDAGSVTLQGKTVVLEGTLRGSVEKGVFQTSASDPTDFLGNLEATGLREPVGGVLTIGADRTRTVRQEGDNTTYYDAVTENVTIQARTPSLSSMFGSEEPLPSSRRDMTYLSSESLNSIGLSALNIYANLSVRTEADASLSLRPFTSSTADGTKIRPTLTLSARRIEHFGEIAVAGGSISLLNPDKNITAFERFRDSAGSGNSRYVEVDGRIYLAEGSVLSAAGERIDNSWGGRGSGGTLATAHTKGGDITVADNETLLQARGEGVIVMGGAVLDVGGGYEIDVKGKVKGGDAGTLTIKGQAVVLNGELTGTSLVGNKGGKIILEAENVEFSRFGATLGTDFRAGSPLPEFFRDRVILTEATLKETGFTQIEAMSFNDITVEAGVTISPSRFKLAAPEVASASGSEGVPNRETSVAKAPARTLVEPEYVGASSLALQAGLLHETEISDDAVDSRVVTAIGSRLEAAPGGKVTIKGPSVDVGGIISAPGGEIKAQATMGDLTIGEWSRLLAAGYAKPSTAAVAGVAAGPEVQDGGKVALAAASNLLLQRGSLVDVSGTSAVSNTIPRADGTPQQVLVASNPGSVSLSYADDLHLDGELRAHAAMPGVRGGGLAISRTNLDKGLKVSADAVERFRNGGFDSLTFSSYRSLEFTGDTVLSLGRSLTLDAPEIRGNGVDRISIQAPWIVLTNSYYPSTSLSTEGTAELRLTAQWLDVTGNIRLSGFGETRLEASHDLTFTDRYYEDPTGDNDVTSGKLTASGNLTMQASRMYPTTQTDFTISGAGKITTLPGEEAPNDKVYSAMGSITIEAMQGIEHGGYLAAPMGSVTLDGKGKRVLLADGSVVSTAAVTAVNLGVLRDTDLSWWLADRSANRSLTTTFEDASQSKPVSIAVKSMDGEVIVNDGARIDASGGGSMFAYLFTPGIDGSINPIAREGTSPGGTKVRADRYVILPDNSVRLPGDAVYLEADESIGLKAGFYSLLPEQYAFEKGALIVSRLGASLPSGQSFVTAEGYRVVAGYATTAGTDLHPSSFSAYSVRRAADVLKEGHFDIRNMVAGNAGAITVSGATTILEGSVAAAPLPGYRGGSLTLSSREIHVTADAGEDTGIPYYFETEIPAAMVGKMRVSGMLLSGSGFSKVSLGDGGTDSITLHGGSVVAADSIVLTATTAITLEDTARIEAVATEGGGTVSLLLPQTARTVDGILISPTVTVGDGALVRASGKVSIAATGLDLRGDMVTPELSLSSNRILFTAAETGSGSLYLPESIWNRFGSLAALELIGAAGIRFTTPVTLSLENSLTLDSGLIEGTGGGDVVLRAPHVVVKNSTRSLSSTAPQEETGTLTLAGGALTVDAGSTTTAGKWNILFDGFSSVNLLADNDMVFQGMGTVRTQGDLNLQAARITTGSYSDSSASFRPSRVAIDSAGAITTAAGSGVPGDASVPGGRLSFSAKNINHGGVVDLPSGQILLSASESINLAEHSLLLARGSRIATAEENHFHFAGGGSIVLQGGSLSMASGSLLDVSAHGEKGDAGSISVSASSLLELDGELRGMKGLGGAGGSFAVEAKSVDFDPLMEKLASGGFDNVLDIRAREGELIVDGTVTARKIRITADGGGITVGSQGVLDVSAATGGGSVELYAKNNLTLEAGSFITASGTGYGSDGGTVLLSSYYAGDLDAGGNPTGGILFKDGARIDVSGTGPGEGGTVWLRALRNRSDGTETDLNLAMGGDISGASAVTAEAARIYSYTGNKSISANDIKAWKSDTEKFLSSVNVAAMRARLGQTDTRYFHLLPGLEIRSAGNLTLGVAWDLSSGWRFGGEQEPGVLTLRAGGNLAISNDLLDHPINDPGKDPSYNTYLVRKSPEVDSWSFNLAAGTDTSSADFMAVKPADGTTNTKALTVASGKLVYTESGTIHFASANETTLNRGLSSRTGIIQDNLLASMATYDGDIRGAVGGKLNLPGGVIQSATGDIDIKVGGDLVFQATDGAIRTTGQYASNGVTYEGGGDIRVEVKGDVSGGFNSSSRYQSVVLSDGSALWTAKHDDNAARGLATMGGGSLSIFTGGQFQSQAGAMGEGDLTIRANGDLMGVFLVSDGTGELTALGNFGLVSSTPVIELMDAVVSVASQGDVNLGMVLNPTLTNTGALLTGGFTTWFMTYSRDAAVSLTSLRGDVTFFGNQYSSKYPVLTSIAAARQNLFPQSLDIIASRDINLKSSITLAPSSHGNLRLLAGGNIEGSVRADKSWTFISMLDSREEDFYTGPWLRLDDKGRLVSYTPDSPALGGSARYVHGYRLVYDADASRNLYVPLHYGDEEPVVISAGGNIGNVQLYLPKKTEMTAGNDIHDIFLVGQNLKGDDMTILRAGHDITLTLPPRGSGAIDSSGVELGGPGYFVLQAGNIIDLGNSKGAQTFGNARNSLLSDEGADLILVSGYTKSFAAEDISAFFQELRAAGNEYSELLAQGESGKAADRVRQAREEVITPFLTESAEDGTGVITMTSSQVSTNAPGSDVYVLAKGSVDVGKSSIELDKTKAKQNSRNTGIFTSQGGGINIYSGNDLNVNESKVMTFFGGDITVWSEGDINAGRGSRTAVSASPPSAVYDPITREYVFKFDPPAVGSGIRAVTYDPNITPGGTLATPAPGNIYLFAPQGVIDAGEAGIAGGRVVLGATEVLNARNISFSVGSVGVPASSDASVSLGALTGSSALTENNKMIEQTALGAAKSLSDSVADKVSQFMSGWLDVKVISFDEEEERKE